MRLVDLNYNFERDWHIELSDNELSDNKLSNNKLSDNNLASELVENRSFLNSITIGEIVIFMIKAGVNVKAVLRSLSTAFLPISRSRFSSDTN